MDTDGHEQKSEIRISKSETNPNWELGNVWTTEETENTERGLTADDADGRGWECEFD